MQDYMHAVMLVCILVNVRVQISNRFYLLSMVAVFSAVLTILYFCRDKGARKIYDISFY